MIAVHRMANEFAAIKRDLESVRKPDERLGSTEHNVPSQSVIDEPRIPLPKELLSLAWGVSGLYSQDADERDRAKNAQTWWEGTRDQFVKKYGPDSPEGRYMLAANASLAGYLRIMAVTLEHRNYNFLKLNQMKDNELKAPQNYASFTGNLQSVVPRLATATIGGYTVPTLLSSVFGITSASATFLALAGAAVVYLVSEVFFRKYGASGINKIYEKYEASKDAYFDEAQKRSEGALKLLCKELVGSYNDIFSKEFGTNNCQSVVEDVMGKSILAHSDRSNASKKDTIASN